MNKNSKKLDKILDIVKCNDTIDKLYKKLLELDKLGLKNSEEYLLVIDVLKGCCNEENEMMKDLSYADDEIEDILTNIQSLNPMADDYINYVDEANNTKIKRLLCHFGQQALIRNDFFDNMFVPNNNVVVIDGMEVSADEALDYLGEIDENCANFISEILNQETERMFEEYSTYNYLLYCRNALQYHTTADYLEEAIANEKNKKIKSKLLEYKYKMIAIYGYLEKPFLKNPYNYSRTMYYQDIFKDYYNDNMEFFTDWDNYYQEQVDDTIASIMENNNEKYNNINERYYNKLNAIYLKAYSSILSNDKLLDITNIKKMFAMNITKNKLNKKLIKSTLNLNQDLLLSKKLTNN